jgi:hypothetical protein
MLLLEEVVVEVHLILVAVVVLVDILQIQITQ